MRFTWSVLVAAFVSCAQPPPATERRPPNIIFILSDDMGFADLGCTGATDIRTPHIDRIAREGASFTDFYSNGPVCTPTRAAFITGRYQQRVGLEWAIFPGQKEPGLRTSETSIARMLKDRGYSTALFGKWHLGYKPEFSANAHGFDEFFGLLSGNHDFYSHKENNGELDLVEGTASVEMAGYTTDLLTERADKFVRNRGNAPFFLYLAYNAVHWPFQPPDRPDTVRTRDTWYSGTREDYKGMLERMDHGVGRILKALDELGLSENTIVVFTNDNGGERLSNNTPFSNRKGTLWEGGIRVPCVVRWPGRIPAGSVCRQAAITMDMTSTLLAAADAKPPSGRRLDGIDLLPALQGRAAPIERTFFWRIDRPQIKQKAARQGNLKYLREREKERLFDVASDPGEKTDLASARPEKVGELRELLARWEAEMDASNPPFKVK